MKGNLQVQAPVQIQASVSGSDPASASASASGSVQGSGSVSISIPPGQEQSSILGVKFTVKSVGQAHAADGMQTGKPATPTGQSTLVNMQPPAPSDSGIIMQQHQIPSGLLGLGGVQGHGPTPGPILTEPQANKNAKLHDNKFVVDKQGNRTYLQKTLENEDCCEGPCVCTSRCVGEFCLAAGAAVLSLTIGSPCLLAYGTYKAIKFCRNSDYTCDYTCDPTCDSCCTCCFPNPDYVLEEKQKEGMHSANLYAAYKPNLCEQVTGPCTTPDINTMTCCERVTSTPGCLTLHPKHIQSVCAVPAGLATALTAAVVATTEISNLGALITCAAGVPGAICACYCCTGLAVNQCQSAVQLAYSAKGVGSTAKALAKALIGAGKVAPDNRGFEGKRSMAIGGAAPADSFKPDLNFVPTVITQPKRSVRNLFGLWSSKPVDTPQEREKMANELVSDSGKIYLLGRQSDRT